MSDQTPLFDQKTKNDYNDAGMPAKKLWLRHKGRNSSSSQPDTLFVLISNALCTQNHMLEAYTARANKTSA